jgi:DinB superfamily
VTSPDPVTEAAAYQQSLLAALGGDDPAIAQASTPAALQSLVAEAGSDLRATPASGEWSVLQCIAHIADGELVASGRYRWILAQDRPPLAGYDQDAWVDALHGDDDDPAALLALFEALRAANLELWRRTPVADRARFGIHSERGLESYELTFKLIAGHDRIHLAQARKTLETVGARRG